MDQVTWEFPTTMKARTRQFDCLLICLAINNFALACDIYFKYRNSFIDFISKYRPYIISLEVYLTLN